MYELAINIYVLCIYTRSMWTHEFDVSSFPPPLPVELSCWIDAHFRPELPAIALGVSASQIQLLVQHHTCKAVPQAHGCIADQTQAPVLHPSAAWGQLKSVKHSLKKQICYMSWNKE